MEIGYTKLKQTSRAFRIWIEGNKLVRNGFDTNQEYRAYYWSNFIQLISSDYLKGYRSYEKNYNMRICNRIANLQVSGARRDGKNRPIIDLHNKTVGQVFYSNELIKIIYEKNSILFIGATK